MVPMARKIAKKRARLGRALSFDECFSIARSALHDALLSWDPARAAFAVHAHATIDRALLDALATARRRADLPVLRAIRATYARASELRERGSVLYDTDEESLRHLHDMSEELAATCGLRLASSSEEQVAAREEARAVREALGEMTAYEAQIVWMRVAEEKTLEEVAVAAGTSKDTVSRDVGRALVRLHALLCRRGVRGGANQGADDPAGGGPRPEGGPKARDGCAAQTSAP
jgi:RNA polymerase sigma factor (sigma-70 family)